MQMRYDEGIYEPRPMFLVYLATNRLNAAEMVVERRMPHMPVNGPDVVGRQPMCRDLQWFTWKPCIQCCARGSSQWEATPGFLWCEVLAFWQHISLYNIAWNNIWRQGNIN